MSSHYLISGHIFAPIQNYHSVIKGIHLKTTWLYSSFSKTHQNLPPHWNILLWLLLIIVKNLWHKKFISLFDSCIYVINILGIKSVENLKVFFLR